MGQKLEWGGEGMRGWTAGRRVVVLAGLVALSAVGVGAAAAEASETLPPAAVALPEEATVPAETLAADVFRAARRGDLSTLQRLLAAGTDPNTADAEGATPLHFAAAADQVRAAEMLLARCADPNARKRNGVTPLHVAAALGRANVLALLLERGGDARAADNDGRTPLSLARGNGHGGTARLLARRLGVTPTLAALPAPQPAPHAVVTSTTPAPAAACPSAPVAARPSVPAAAPAQFPVRPAQLTSRGQCVSREQCTRAFIEVLIDRIAREEGMEPALVRAVVQVESGYNPLSLSHCGAMGLMQLMPGTAQGLGVTDPWDLEQNLRGGSRYLRQMLSAFGDLRLALAAYNAGPNAVRRAPASSAT